MVERVLTGSRVRSRRLDLGLAQADVAQRVGISGSYLNLIEHNRRRIGTKLLGDLADVLSVDPRVLEEEPAAAILAPLTEAAAAFPQAGADGSAAQDLVARFPGWAGVIAAQQTQITQLRDKVEALSNRLAHDTQIASSLHEVISTATSIRSTASILAETPDLDPDWQSRFHHNIDNDSARLAQSSQALLGFLDMDVAESVDGSLGAASAVEQAEAQFVARGFHLAEAEIGQAVSWPDVKNRVVADILHGWSKAYAADAAALPLAEFLAVARATAFDPARIAARFSAPLGQVLRRLAQLPVAPDVPPMGIVQCDAAGVVTFQKPVLDFRLPRAGAACPLWPLYQAISQPGRGIHATVRQQGAARTPFECFAIAAPVGDMNFGAPTPVESIMLVRPARIDAGDVAQTVGAGCRVCSVEGCLSRRQPSVLPSAAAT